jgi:hypothetical protein
MPREKPIFWHYAMPTVLRFADPWALKYVEPAFNGNPDAAFGLAVALGNAKRGAVAVAMWRARVPRPAFRVYLEAAWAHDHAWVIDAAGTRRRLAAMFRYAAFFPPSFIGESVLVWRGTAGVSMSVARAGYSWTLNRDTACWFAMRFHGPVRKPLVLCAEVPRDEIVLYGNERGEAEVVLMRAPAASVDGTIDEWRIRYKVVEAARLAANRPQSN